MIGCFSTLATQLTFLKSNQTTKFRPNSDALIKPPSTILLTNSEKSQLSLLTLASSLLDSRPRAGFILQLHLVTLFQHTRWCWTIAHSRPLHLTTSSIASSDSGIEFYLVSSSQRVRWRWIIAHSRIALFWNYHWHVHFRL